MGTFVKGVFWKTQSRYPLVATSAAFSSVTPAPTYRTTAA